MQEQNDKREKKDGITTHNSCSPDPSRNINLVPMGQTTRYAHTRNNLVNEIYKEEQEEVNKGIQEIYPMLVKKGARIKKESVNSIKLHILLKEKRKVEIENRMQEIRSLVREIDEIEAIESKKKILKQNDPISTSTVAKKETKEGDKLKEMYHRFQTLRADMKEKKQKKPSNIQVSTKNNLFKLSAPQRSRLEAPLKSNTDGSGMRTRYTIKVKKDCVKRVRERIGKKRVIGDVNRKANLSVETVRNVRRSRDENFFKDPAQKSAFLPYEGRKNRYFQKGSKNHREKSAITLKPTFKTSRELSNAVISRMQKSLENAQKHQSHSPAHSTSKNSKTSKTPSKSKSHLRITKINLKLDKIKSSLTNPLHAQNPQKSQIAEEIKQNYLTQGFQKCYNLVQECNDVNNKSFKAMYEWKKECLHLEEQMAYDVCKEYKHALGDPARMVAKIEAKILTGNGVTSNRGMKMKNFTRKVEMRSASNRSLG